MRSHQLRAALTDFVEEASLHLAREIETGAEVPFEIVTQKSSRAGTPMYSYRPLTSRFIVSRAHTLTQLPSHRTAVGLLAACDCLERYLLERGIDRPPDDGRARARLALQALLSDVFADQTDFQLHHARLDEALDRLEDAQEAGPHKLVVVAMVHGLALSCARLVLSRGVVLTAPDDLDELPDALGQDPPPHVHALAVVTVDANALSDPLGHCRDVLRGLLRALRLYGDARVGFGALAWSRLGSGPWRALALGDEPCSRSRGALILLAPQEDELRAFNNLLARRAPREGEVAWALHR